MRWRIFPVRRLLPHSRSPRSKRFPLPSLPPPYLNRPCGLRGRSRKQGFRRLRFGRKRNRKPLVLLVGDSMMMEGFGPVLQRTLRKRPDLDVVREGKYSTGLSRQDYFVWPAQLEEAGGEVQPGYGRDLHGGQ